MVAVIEATEVILAAAALKTLLDCYFVLLALGWLELNLFLALSAGDIHTAAVSSVAAMLISSRLIVRKNIIIHVLLVSNYILYLD